MIGIALHHWHIAPREAWQFTFREYWAAMRVANPDLDEAINSDGEFFSAEELAVLSNLKRMHSDGNECR